MPPRYVVVDGSNIATEGRSVPSLAQLDEAVRAFMQERPDDQVIVVVDASFGYRIDESERREYEAAEAAGEIVSPPAGAIGRGDKFLLQIADRTSAVVLSNDSFQEFHAEYGWLFDQGRLMGGKPVPGVGWIFTARAPVRGPRSREVLRAAKKGQRGGRRAAVAEGPVADAIAEATAEVIAPHSEEDAPADETAEDGATKGGRRGRRRHSKPAGTVNDPLPFIEFIAEHPLGSEVTGEVDSFTSHGAFVRVANARCYVPLVALGDPAPRSAKEVLKRGEIRPFVVQALDPPRRGIELAMPGVARVAGTPTEETVEADIGAGRKSKSRRKAPEPAPEPVVEEAAAAAAAAASGASEPVPAKPRRSRKKAAEPVPVPDVEEPPTPARPARRTRKKAAAVVVEAGPDAEVVAVSEPVVEEPTPAKPRRTRKKAAEPAVPEPERAPAEPEPAPAEPAPAKGKRSRKKAPAAPVAPEPVAPGEPDAAPAPPAERPRRTRKAAAKAAPVVEVQPEAEPPPEPPPAKKSRSRKKAAEPPAEAPAPEPAPVKKSRARKKSAG